MRIAQTGESALCPVPVHSSANPVELFIYLRLPSSQVPPYTHQRCSEQVSTLPFGPDQSIFLAIWQSDCREGL